MVLRQLLTTIIAAVIGAVVGSLMTSSAQPPQGGGMDRLTTHEIVILSDQGRPVARLGSDESGTTLRFFSANSEPALEIGIDHSSGDTKFMRLLGKRGRVVAALNSLPPNGESTLYLGDERWQARIVVGALRTEMDSGAENINDWGMQFRKPNSNQIPLSMLLRPAKEGYRATLRIESENGHAWGAP